MSVMMLENPGTWNLYLLALLLCVVLFYGIFLKQTTPVFIPLLFLFSIGLFYVLIGSPLTAFMELSFSLHMIHMSILYFIVPPLFLLGIPKNIYEQIFSFVKYRSFVSPIHALYLFSFLLFLYHIPFVLNFISQYVIYLNAYKATLFILSFFMWSPIVSPTKKERRSRLELRNYMVKCGIWITPACLFFIVTSFIHADSNALLTQFSAHLCIVPSDAIDISPVFFQTKTDQFLAGVCMFGLHKFSLMMTQKIAKYR